MFVEALETSIPPDLLRTVGTVLENVDDKGWLKLVGEGASVATEQKKREGAEIQIVAITKKKEGQKKNFVQGMNVMVSSIPLTAMTVSAGNCSHVTCPWEGTQRSSTDTSTVNFVTK